MSLKAIARGICVVLSGAWLAACDTYGTGTATGDPYSTTGSAYGDATTTPGLAAAGGTTAAPAGGYVVAAGDTLYAVSRKTGVPLRALIDANGLAPPYQLSIGRRLVIPEVATYTVASGDTFYGISHRLGIDMSELARLNGIEPPYIIAQGQVLVLPATASPAASAGSAPALAAAPDPTQPVPGAGGTVDVQPLGPPSGIAAAPSPSEGLVPTEPLSSPVPGAGESGAGGVQPDLPAPAPLPTAPSVQPTPAPAPAAVGPTVLPDPPARAGSKFIWPVDGPIVSGFGPKDGGLHNDGINIAAPRGTPVKAAENGVVAFVGDELKGFGSLVLVKHDGGYVTAYAHNDQVLVQRGSIVRRGETIARVGSSGNVSTPQLHFEVRKGSRAVDPIPLMTAQTAER